MLAGAVSRWRWLLTAVASALVGSAVLMFFAGLGNGLGAGITLGEPETIVRLTLAGLAYVPAMAVLAGIAALAVAVRHAGSVGSQSHSSSCRCISARCCGCRAG